MFLKWPYKDPAEVLDYQIDWSKRLESDTVAASTWTVTPSDGTLLIGTGAQAPTWGPRSTTVWLSGGTLDVTYTVTNTMTSARGRVMEQSVELEIKSK